MLTVKGTSCPGAQAIPFQTRKGRLLRYKAAEGKTYFLVVKEINFKVNYWVQNR